MDEYHINSGNKKGYYCERPFTDLVVAKDGHAFICACPVWNNHYYLGNVFEDRDIWNGIEAQKFRAAVLAGTFDFCNVSVCPSLRGKSGFIGRKEDLESTERFVSQDVLQKRLHVNHGARNVFLAYDNSCNLACPSCRGTRWEATEEERGRVEQIHKIVTEKYLDGMIHLSMSGAGDPFSSPVYLNLLRTMTNEKFSNLRQISLLTNGLSFKEGYETFSDFARSKIKVVDISVDAAEEKTYLINRRGGDWKLLMKNLQYLSDLRESGSIERLHLHFVVQRNNYRQMREFVLLGKKLKADNIDFQMFGVHFIRWTRPQSYFYEWEKKAIHEPFHPEYLEFKNLLSSLAREFQQEISVGEITLGQLDEVRYGTYQSQHEILRKEFLSNKC